MSAENVQNSDKCVIDYKDFGYDLMKKNPTLCRKN